MEKVTTMFDEMARNADGSVNPEGLRKVQETIWSAMPESTRRGFFEFKGRQSCAKAAMARPLPGAAGLAFTKGAIKAGGKTVASVVPAHFAVLQALESPLLKMIENAMTQKSVNVDFKPKEQWEICYVFTADIEATYELLESDGVAAIRKVAKKAVGMTWDASSLNLVMLAVLEQVKRHAETLVRFAADMEATKEISFFLARPENQ